VGVTWLLFDTAQGDVMSLLFYVVHVRMTVFVAVSTMVHSSSIQFANAIGIRWNALTWIWPVRT